jgi:hypothetical protein
METLGELDELKYKPAASLGCMIARPDPYHFSKHSKHPASKILKSFETGSPGWFQVHHGERHQLDRIPCQLSTGIPLTKTQKAGFYR